jgi:hypothetical protein
MRSSDTKAPVSAQRIPRNMILARISGLTEMERY